MCARRMRIAPVAAFSMLAMSAVPSFAGCGTAVDIITFGVTAIANPCKPFGTGTTPPSRNIPQGATTYDDQGNYIGKTTGGPLKVVRPSNANDPIRVTGKPTPRMSNANDPIRLTGKPAPVMSNAGQPIRLTGTPTGAPPPQGGDDHARRR